MPIPVELQSSIEQVINRFAPSELKRSAEQLSAMYRQGGPTVNVSMRTDLERCAYLAMRLPGTYGAISAALRQARAKLEALGVHSLLDLGAGPGTAAWAAIYGVGGISEITLVEKDQSLVHIGKTLGASAPVESLSKATWLVANLESSPPFTPHDLVIASYALSELSADGRAAVLKKAWAATSKALVLIEPETPVGFNQLREMRQTLLSLGAHILAPCPHALECPMAPNDWCHFSARVERTKLHRYLKSGDLGYEDEKFSYLVVSKVAPASHSPVLHQRIIRHPQYNPRTVDLTLCTTDGTQKHASVRKSEGDVYKRARKADWGDGFILNPEP